MELNNLSFDELSKWIGLDENSYAAIGQIQNYIKTRDKLEGILPSLWFKNVFDQIHNVRFDHISLNELSLRLEQEENIIADNNRFGFPIEVQNELLLYTISFDGIPIEVVYIKQTGLIYSIKSSNIYVRNLDKKANISDFPTTIDSDTIDIVNLRLLIKTINECKLQYSNAFNPLLKSLYINNKKILLSNNKQENSVKELEEIIDLIARLEQSHDGNVPKNLELVIRDKTVPFSYIRYGMFIGLFNEYLDITHIGIWTRNKIYTVDLQEEGIVADEISRLAREFEISDDIVTYLSTNIQKFMPYMDL